MATRSTGYKAVIERLDQLESNLPNANGDITLLLSKMENLSDDVAKIAIEFNKLKLNVYNPESGVIVRVNRNSEFRKNVETGWPGMAQKLDNLRNWKGNVNKVLWVLFLSTLALIVDIIATHL